ncbi:homeotic protein caudal [Onthophagus taurus]|uniref:homeotic protein caudal n=1 Tax=Onthophagus taurus TaxID=166361 RepID=UPI000C202403|nr:homeotic protein caudal isoform X2 [Onthophagus taurus]
MFHPRQGGSSVNHQNMQHHGLHHQWYQAYHHQGGFAQAEENGWHHHHITPHIYPPSPDINDFLQGNLVHNFQQGYPMVQPPSQHHQRVSYPVDMQTHVSGGEVPQMPSPISGSDLSSPGLNPGEMSPQAPSSHTVNRPPPVRSPYEWIKKNSYQNQPNPGKTRTKDKYRVVYTDHQRVELEKEFYFSRYITIRKKSELALTLGLSERQVKIWFQNRRAKERKQTKKRQEMAMTKDPLDISLEQQQQQQTSTILNHAVSPNQGISLM